MKSSELYSAYVKSCVTCKYGVADDWNDVICICDTSEYCTEYVERGFQCRSWEGHYGEID